MPSNGVVIHQRRRFRPFFFFWLRVVGRLYIGVFWDNFLSSLLFTYNMSFFAKNLNNVKANLIFNFANIFILI